MVASMHAMSIGIGEVVGPLLGGFAAEHLPTLPVGDLPYPGDTKNLPYLQEMHGFSTVLWICSNGEMSTRSIAASKECDVLFSIGNVSLLYVRILRSIKASRISSQFFFLSGFFCVLTELRVRSPCLVEIQATDGRRSAGETVRARNASL